MRSPRYMSFAAATVFLGCPQAMFASPDETDARLVELISQLDDPEPTVRRPAAYAIAHSIPDPTPAMDAMIQVLEGDDLHMQGSAVFAIARMGTKADRAVPVIAGLLRKPDQGLATSSIRTLGAIGPKAVPVLTETLRHPDAIVARAAAEELGHLGAMATPAIPALLRAARHADRNVAKSAVRALPYIGRDGMEAAATLLLSDLPQDRMDDLSLALLLAPVDVTVAIPALVRAATDEKIGVYPAGAILRRAGERAVPPLLEVLESGSPRTRELAILCLGEIGPAASSAIAPILRIANDSANDHALRRTAIREVGRIARGSAQPLPQLIAMLKHGPENLRADVIYGLGLIGPAAVGALPELLTILRSTPHGHVRGATVEAIGLLGPDAAAAVPALRVALRDDKPIVRHFTVSALGRIGPGAEAAVPDLLALLTEDHRTNRHEIARSVGKILTDAVESPPEFTGELKQAFESGRSHRQLVRRGAQDQAIERKLLARQQSMHTRIGKLGLVGVVMDENEKPVAEAQVTLRAYYGPRAGPPTGGRATIVKCGEQGIFAFESTPFQKAVLDVMAEGYAAHRDIVETTDRTRPIRVKLTPGKPVNVLVVGEEGEPVRGATVEHPGWSGPLAPRATTDRRGKCALTLRPSGAILTIQHPEYLTRRVNTSRHENLEVIVKLRKRFRVRGTVTDAATGERIPGFEIRVGLVLAGPAVFQDEEPPVRYGNDGGYEWTPRKAFEPSELVSSRVLAAEAPGYLRAVSRPIADTDGDAVIDFALTKTSNSFGTLLFPDGQPVVGADLFLSKKTDMFRPAFVDGRLSRSGERMPRTTTDDQGYFEFPPPNEPFIVIAQHDSGVAIARQEDLRRFRPVILQPWARVEGRLDIAGAPAAKETVVLKVVEYEARPRLEPAFPGAEFTYKLDGNPDLLTVRFQYRAKTDAEGRFSFDRVKPGEVRVEREASLGGMIVTYTHSAGGTALPGRTLTLHIVRVGRRVEGQVALPPTEDKWDDPCTTHGSAHLTRLPHGGADSEVFSFALGTDGHFRANDIPAGEYQLTIDVFCEKGVYNMKPTGIVNQHVTVPEITEGDTSAVNLGRVGLKRVNMLSAGDLAPPLTLIDLAGVQTRLAALRGKIVLLHFSEINWDPWARRTDHLKALYQNRAENDRFIMISVYLEADEDRVRRFARERELSWPHFVVNPEEIGEIRSAFGLHRLVNMVLINADGTIRKVITDPTKAGPV